MPKKYSLSCLYSTRSISQIFQIIEKAEKWKQDIESGLCVTNDYYFILLNIQVTNLDTVSMWYSGNDSINNIVEVGFIYKTPKVRLVSWPVFRASNFLIVLCWTHFVSNKRKPKSYKIQEIVFYLHS